MISICSSGEEEIVDLLIKNGADVNIENSDKKTPLYLAANGGFDKIVKILIENGADLNYKTTDEKTALHLASMNGIY